MTKFMIFVILGSIVIQSNSAQQNVLDQGLTVLAGVAAKGKEIIDRGVNIKSEKQQSIDLFGLKLGANNGVNTGFGDAASDNPSTSSAEDELLRKKRSMDLLATLRSTGLVGSSATGLSVNVVTINSVSNVNNYGPTPETTTTAESRRRRRFDPTTLDETLSYLTKKNELKPNSLHKRRPGGETSFVPFGISDSQIKHDGLTLDVSLQATDKNSIHRSKRSPQESNTEVVVPPPMNPSGNNGTRDGPEGGPNDGGCGRRGPGGKGPGPGRGGNRRGPPPPPPPSAEDDSDDEERRKKRETMHSAGGYSSNSDYKSSSSEYYSSESAENVSPEWVVIDIETDQQRRDKRSPCGRRRVRRQNVTTTTVATTTARRRKREITPEQGAEHAKSWFSTVLEVIVDSARRVVEATRKVFTKDQKEGMANNEDVEAMD